MRSAGRTLAAAAAIAAALAASALPAHAVVSETTSYQGDAAHTGGVIDPALDGPLRVSWSRRLAEGLSPPVVAGGRVFVLSPAAGGASDVVALDAGTGAELWRHPVLSTEGITYGAGAVYVVNHRGSLIAFDAATGATRWSRDDPTYEVDLVRSAPAYFAGTVFYTGQDVASRTHVVAVSALDGTPLWESPTMPYDAHDAAVAVDAQGVFASNENGFAASWTLSGAQRWVIGSAVDGPAPNLGRQTVVVGARVFTAMNTGAVLDTTTGRTVDAFVRALFGPVPAFGPTHVAVLSDGQLTIADRATLTTTGQYAAAVPGTELRAQPFFVGERVFTVDTDHHLIGVDAATATPSTDIDLDSQLPGVPGGDGGGIGVGGGVIAVATTDGRLVAVTGEDAPTATEPREVAGEARLAAPASATAPLAAAPRVRFPGGAKLRSLTARGLVVDVAGAGSGATLRATLIARGKVVWHVTTHVPKSGRVRLKAARRPTRATAARLELRVTAAHAAPVVVRRTLR